MELLGTLCQGVGVELGGERGFNGSLNQVLVGTGGQAGIQFQIGDVYGQGWGQEACVTLADQQSKRGF